jgi:hypothetical protein
MRRVLLEAAIAQLLMVEAVSDDVMSKDRAESATGISAMQVSRWRKSLRDPQKYRG